MPFFQAEFEVHRSAVLSEIPIELCRLFLTTLSISEKYFTPSPVCDILPSDSSSSLDTSEDWAPMVGSTA